MRQIFCAAKTLCHAHIQIMLIVIRRSTNILLIEFTGLFMLMQTRRFILARFLSIPLVMLFGAAAADQADKEVPPAQTSPQLIMVEQDGCIYCARWNAEISDIYPKTPEGKFAPLRRMDLRAEPPKDISFKGPLAITPTFVLVENGVEQARIEGYGGDEMFWAMLTVTLQNYSDFSRQITE